MTLVGSHCRRHLLGQTVIRVEKDGVLIQYNMSFIIKGNLNTETDTVGRQCEDTWAEDGHVFSAEMYLQAKEHRIVRKDQTLEETEEGSPPEPSETTQPC